MASSTSPASVIATTAELETFLSAIPPSTTLYLDLEGQSLCRHGTISLITILLHPQKIVRLVDVLSLGKSAFTTTSKDGKKSLKSIFEDPTVPKCLWDVRNDADALLALYNVNLAGVTDIQLLENASRRRDKTYLYGLDKAIQSDLRLRYPDYSRWKNTKTAITALMRSNIFAVRPLDAKTIQYCANDVVHLPSLRDLYLKRIKPDWLEKAKQESARRVEEVHSPSYQPHSPNKKMGPWGSGTDGGSQ
ncbi:ribonuclease H-like domain-containing protein [Cladorrhinum sp. PSN332]|nr:ribonuclease H-like domain-containing protein [Cladorrhinum sp. PSN332]